MNILCGIHSFRSMRPTIYILYDGTIPAERPFCVCSRSIRNVIRSLFHGITDSHGLHTIWQSIRHFFMGAAHPLANFIYELRYCEFSARGEMMIQSRLYAWMGFWISHRRLSMLSFAIRIKCYMLPSTRNIVNLFAFVYNIYQFYWQCWTSAMFDGAILPAVPLAHVQPCDRRPVLK